MWKDNRQGAPARAGHGRKRSYRPATLVRYGSLRKLTQGSSGTMSETSGMKGCL